MTPQAYMLYTTHKQTRSRENIQSTHTAHTVITTITAQNDINGLK